MPASDQTVPFDVEAYRASTASGIQGLPVASTAPAAGDVLGLISTDDITQWAPRSLTDSSAFDIRWTILHGVAPAACLSRATGEGGVQVAIARQQNTNCSATCEASNGRTREGMMAVGSLLPSQATVGSRTVTQYFAYLCEDATTNAADEVAGGGLGPSPVQNYFGYCCCGGNVQ